MNRIADGCITGINGHSSGSFSENGMQNAGATIEDVSKAETAFIEKDYANSLRLANQILLSEIKVIRSASCSQAQASSYGIRTPLQKLAGYHGFVSLQVGLSASILAPADRAAALVLQCQLKVDAGNEKLLGPFFHYYSGSIMPLELFTVFVQYLVHSNNRSAALEISLETLHWVKSCAAFRGPDQEAIDELFWTVTTKLLFYIVDSDPVNRLTDEANTEWRPIRNVSWRKAPLPSVLKKIYNDLTEWNGPSLASPECIERCLEEIKAIGAVNGTFTVDENLRGRDVLALSAPRVLHNDAQTWFRSVKSRIAQVIRDTITQPKLKSEHCWGSRRQIALTALTCYIAWKQRKRLAISGAILAAFIVKPMKEILEALLPTLDQKG